MPIFRFAKIERSRFHASRVERATGGGVEQPRAQALVVGQVLAGEDFLGIYRLAEGAESELPAQAFDPFRDFLLALHQQLTLIHLDRNPVEAPDLPSPLGRGAGGEGGISQFHLRRFLEKAFLLLDRFHLGEQPIRLLQLGPGDFLAQQFLSLRA